MTLNPRTKTALKLFLPLAVTSIALVAGELKANAKEPTTVKTANTVSTKGAALLGQPSIDVNQNAVVQEFSRLTIAQSTPSNPSEITPGRSTPGSTPSGSPTNPSDTTPSNTTPSNTTPSNTTPSTITPSNTTPSTPSEIAPGRAVPGNTPSGSPTNPSDTTPSNTTPTSPLNTTPVTPETTPSSPLNTTPGTTTPGTTTPGTITPETTPGTTPITPLQTPTVEPGRATRSGSSYVGVGGNIGIGNGDISLGQGSFALISKIGLTRNFSVRPSVLFNDDVAILIPITYDFSFGEGPTGGLGFTAAPYLGVGAAISTGDGGDVGLLLTGGIDVPISSQFTATAAVNASVTGQSAVGVMIGIGYNFAGF